MKPILTLFALILSIGLIAQTSPPSGPPNKVCYDYDAAGNRIAQKPAWIMPLYSEFDVILLQDKDAYPCNCNNPLTTRPNLFGVIYVNDIRFVVDISVWYNVVQVFDIRNLPPYFTNPNQWGIWPYSPDPNNEEPLNPKEVIVPLTDGKDKTNVIVVYDPIGQMTSDFSSPSPLIPVQKSITNPEANNEATVHLKIEITIVPNPTYGRFTLNTIGFENENTNVLILNQAGQIMLQRTLENGEFNISEFVAGTYILVASDGKVSKSLQFVKY